jgi:tRNA(Ile)-lysidine synthase
MPQRSDLYARWSQDMRRTELFGPGERVGVAVSGGPDSVLLLEFMRQLAREKGLVVAVVHFNHHLRGTESDEDERFVRDLAGRLGLGYLRGDADVHRLARERRRNLEATARELRYRFFFSLVNCSRLDKVATAHTANDQAETVFLRLLRGTGTRGLGGIRPVLDGKIVRPFLAMTRVEIEAEIERRKLEFRVDSSNRDPRLRRNRVRLELLPWLQERFQVDIIHMLNDLADRARDDEEYLEEQAREQAHPWRVREGAAERIAVRPFAEFPPAIARRILRQMILAARGTLQGITHTHLEELRRLATQAQSGRCLALPGDLVARRQFDWLVIGPQPDRLDDTGFCYVIEVPAEVSIPQLGATFGFKIVGPKELGRAYNEPEKACLDPLRLPGGLVLRNWRAGDRFQPLGCRKVLKLKELFRQRKIPLEQRKLWPVLESGKQIVWVRGFRVAAAFAATSEARQAIIVEEGPSPSHETRGEPR